MNCRAGRFVRQATFSDRRLGFDEPGNLQRRLLRSVTFPKLGQGRLSRKIGEIVTAARFSTRVNIEAAIVGRRLQAEREKHL